MPDGAPVVLRTDLSVDYPQKNGVLRGVRLEVSAGEVVGLVGGSGAGKSTLALALMRLLGHTGAVVRGSISVDGAELMDVPERRMREWRGRVMSLVPQGASGALNPVLRIGTQLREAWKAHSSVSWDAAWPEIRKLVVGCGLPDDDTLLRRFPAEISIGQAQRVLIVMALMHRPSLVIADEPTSALDVITQSDVLDLLASFTVERKMGVLLISHDLSVVAAACDRIAILHDGEVVEFGATEAVLTSPVHAYTQKLVRALRRLRGSA